MKLFTLKHDGKKHRVGLIMRQPSKSPKAEKQELYWVSCVAFKQPDETSKPLATGLKLVGDVPVKELVRWAKRKGFLEWNRTATSKSVKPVKQAKSGKSVKITAKKQELKHERNAEHGIAKAVSGAPGGGR